MMVSDQPGRNPTVTEEEAFRRKVVESGWHGDVVEAWDDRSTGGKLSGQRRSAERGSTESLMA